MQNFLTEEELAKKLRISRTSLWARRKDGLPHCRIGNLVRYPADEVERWLLKTREKELSKLETSPV